MKRALLFGAYGVLLVTVLVVPTLIRRDREGRGAEADSIHIAAEDEAVLAAAEFGWRHGRSGKTWGESSNDVVRLVRRAME